jgi:hypothetical protein
VSAPQTLVEPRERLMECLANPNAVLSRSDLRELGWERRAVDAIVRACPAIAVPGYSRTVDLVRDYLELVERATYRGDRVRPTA